MARGSNNGKTIFQVTMDHILRQGEQRATRKQGTVGTLAVEENRIVSQRHIFQVLPGQAWLREIGDRREVSEWVHMK